MHDHGDHGLHRHTAVRAAVFHGRKYPEAEAARTQQRKDTHHHHANIIEKEDKEIHRRTRHRIGIHLPREERGNDAASDDCV